MPTLQPKFLKPAGFAGEYLATAPFQTAAGAAANTPYISFRWTSSTHLCVVTHLSLRVSCTASAATGPFVFEVLFARSFTASDSGGTAHSLTGNAFKKRTAYATTKLGDFRSGLGAALTPGTRTLDAVGLMGVSIPSSGSFEASDGPVHDLRRDPIVLAQNEGLVVQNILLTAASVARGSMLIEWMELENGSL